MKSVIKKIGLLSVTSAFILGACKKGPDVNILSTGQFATSGGTTLKDAADFPIGAAVELSKMKTIPAYASITTSQFDGITFGNELKNSSIVNSSGVFNYASADEFLALATAGGLQVYGHTLGWHSQQAATYYKSYAGITIPAAVELVPANVDFEGGLTGWSIFNTNGATISASTVAADAHAGTGSMKVVNPTAQTGNQWKVQVSSAAIPTTPGKQYNISYWVKAASAGGSIRLSTGPTAAQYQGDQTIGTSWQLVSWTITATLSSTTFLFDMGQVANTYNIDDASCKEVVIAPSGAQVSLKVDTALNKFVTTTVARYAGKIKAWDVINELFTDDGNIRNNTNSPAPSGATDWFVWSEYLGRDYALKAFNYAKAADPAALLFINDYNLESSNAKLDSLIAFVKELKTKGAKVDGIGTQMHISTSTSYAAIDAMFQKLAATGLLVRVSELDVKANPTGKSGFVLTPELADYQAVMFKYVINSYIKNVPAAQRHGITIWGIDDATSWLYNGGKEFPLLYNADYSKKAAFGGVLQALQGK